MVHIKKIVMSLIDETALLGILQGRSALRILMNREIAKNCKNITGSIIDIGSGNSEYYRLFGRNALITRTDIDPSSGAELIFDANEKFPIKSNTFDYVFCMNVLEHLREPQNLVNESYRILRKGGTIFLGVPFLYPYHSNAVSADCFRYTHDGVTHMLAKAGFSRIKVQRLGGRFTTHLEFFSQSIPIFFRPAIRLALPLTLLLDECMLSAIEKHRGKAFYLGLFVKAKKV